MAQWMNFQSNKSVVAHPQYVANCCEENWACSSANGSYGMQAGWKVGRQNISGFQNFYKSNCSDFSTSRVLLQCQHYILVSKL